MSLQNPYAQYRQTQTVTASQSKLIIMLHDGAIRALQQAIPATQARDYEKMSTHYNKATDILGHLSSSLKTDSGEIAVNLGQIYVYCMERITVANAAEDTSIAQEVIGHIRTIRDAWAQAEQANVAPAKPNPPSTHERRDLSFAA